MNGRFIKSQHPKAAVAPTQEQVRAILSRGWVGQPKLDGHRLQIHISPDGNELISYTRQGDRHTAPLTAELRGGFKEYSSADGWITLEGEWIKSQRVVHLFDILQHKSELLIGLSYGDRYKRLMSIYQFSHHIRLIRVLKSSEECIQVLQNPDPQIEGLVLKAWKTPGWDDTGIVRCRKAPAASRRGFPV